MASDGHGRRFGPYTSSGCLFAIMYCLRIALSTMNNESQTLDESMLLMKRFNSYDQSSSVPSVLLY